jgi:hypothetical protein
MSEQKSIVGHFIELLEAESKGPAASGRAPIQELPKIIRMRDGHLLNPEKDRDFIATCEDFLMQTAHLDRGIGDASDKKRLKLLQRAKTDLHCQFADYLRTSTFSLYHADLSLDVSTCWKVDGVPSKKAKAEAQDWMKTRGVEWDGSALPLRAQVHRALNKKEYVPEGKFGLRVELTILMGRSNWSEARQKSGVSLTRKFC